MTISIQPIAASIPLGTTLSAYIILLTITFQPPPVDTGKMSYKVIEALIYSIDKYFALTGLTDPNH